MHTFIKKGALPVLAGTALIGTATNPPAMAQDQATVAETPQIIREQITVTTQKREQTLQEVPLSVSVVQGDFVEDMGLTRFQDLSTTIPNLQIEESLGSPVIHMRGLGSGAANFAFEQSVGLFVDGVYSGRSHLFESPLFDIERVEVVRGPQGALFGKNTNAGAISITSRRPTDEFEALFRAGYEVERNGYNFEGIVSGPISDRLRARLAAKVFREGGYVRNLFNDKNEPSEDGYLLRGTVEFDASDTFEAILKVEGGEVDGKGGWFQMTDFGNAPLSDAYKAADPNAEANLDGFRSVSTGLDPEFSNTDTFNATLTMNWTIGEHVLTSITSYAEFDYAKNVEFTGTSLGLGQSLVSEDFEQISQELRLASPVGQTVEYIVGFLYLNTEMTTGQRTTIRQFGPFSGFSFRDYTQDGETFSVFGSATVNITDDLRITGGLRYSHETKEGHAIHTTGGIVFPTWLPYDLMGRRKENSWSPSVNLQYDLNDDITTYFTYARGNKTGGFLSNDSTLLFRINQGTNDFEYEDETAESFEVGLKSTLFNGRATLNIALFLSNFDDLQVSAFNGDFFVTGNAAKARVKGVEIEGTALLADTLTLSGGLAYLDANYIDYPGGQCLFGATEADGCDPVTRTQNLAGARLNRAPKWDMSFTLDWQQPVANSLQLSAQLNVTYKSYFFHQPDLDPGDGQEGYVKLNARIALGDLDSRWEFAVVGRNLTDKITKNWSFDTPFFGGGAHTASIAPRRTITLEALLRL